MVREDPDQVRFSGLARMDGASGTAVRVTEGEYKDLPANEKAHFEGDMGNMMIVYVPRDGENGIVDNPTARVSSSRGSDQTARNTLGCP